MEIEFDDDLVDIKIEYNFQPSSPESDTEMVTPTPMSQPVIEDVVVSQSVIEDIVVSHPTVPLLPEYENTAGAAPVETRQQNDTTRRRSSRKPIPNPRYAETRAVSCSDRHSLSKISDVADGEPGIIVEEKLASDLFLSETELNKYENYCVELVGRKDPDGSEYFHGFQINETEPGQFRCDGCADYDSSVVFENKSNLVQHIKYTHLGMTREKELLLKAQTLNVPNNTNGTRIRVQKVTKLTEANARLTAGKKEQKQQVKPTNLDGSERLDKVIRKQLDKATVKRKQTATQSEKVIIPGKRSSIQQERHEKSTVTIYNTNTFKSTNEQQSKNSAITQKLSTDLEVVTGTSKQSTHEVTVTTKQSTDEEQLETPTADAHQSNDEQQLDTHTFTSTLKHSTDEQELDTQTLRLTLKHSTEELQCETFPAVMERETNMLELEIEATSVTVSSKKVNNAQQVETTSGSNKQSSNERQQTKKAVITRKLSTERQIDTVTGTAQLSSVGIQFDNISVVADKSTHEVESETATVTEEQPDVLQLDRDTVTAKQSTDEEKPEAASVTTKLSSNELQFDTVRGSPKQSTDEPQCDTVVVIEEEVTDNQQSETATIARKESSNEQRFDITAVDAKLLTDEEPVQTLSENPIRSTEKSLCSNVSNLVVQLADEKQLKTASTPVNLPYDEQEVDTASVIVKQSTHEQQLGAVTVIGKEPTDEDQFVTVSVLAEPSTNSQGLEIVTVTAEQSLDGGDRQLDGVSVTAKQSTYNQELDTVAASAKGSTEEQEPSISIPAAHKLTVDEQRSTNEKNLDKVTAMKKISTNDKLPAKATKSTEQMRSVTVNLSKLRDIPFPSTSSQVVRTITTRATRQSLNNKTIVETRMVTRKALSRAKRISETEPTLKASDPDATKRLSKSEATPKTSVLARRQSKSETIPKSADSAKRLSKSEGTRKTLPPPAKRTSGPGAIRKTSALPKRVSNKSKAAPNSDAITEQKLEVDEFRSSNPETPTDNSKPKRLKRKPVEILGPDVVLTEEELTTYAKSSLKDLATKTHDGKEVLGEYELKPLENGKFPCPAPACPNIYLNKYTLASHIKFRHLGFSRAKYEIARQLQEKKNGPKIVKDKDGVLTLGEIKLMPTENNLWACGKCGRELRTKHNMISHIKTLHLKIKNKKYLFKPNQYGPKTLKQQIMGRTVTTEDGKKFYEGVEVISVPGTSDVFKCGSCSKTFNWAGGILTHIKKRHLTQNSSKLLSCSICGKKFPYLYLLRTHEKIHDQAQHQCEHCGVRFKTFSILRSHVERVHDGVRKYQCDSCEKMFYTKKDCERHMNTHTRLERFSCSCTMTFTQLSSLKRHQSRERHPPVAVGQGEKQDTDQTITPEKVELEEKHMPTTRSKSTRRSAAAKSSEASPVKRLRKGKL